MTSATDDHPHEEPPVHLTEFAHALAERLPGWQPSPHTVLIADEPAGARMWDSGPMPYTAYEAGARRTVLTHHWGLQLYVLPRPHRPRQYLVLPMLPANTSYWHARGIRAPRGIAVPDDPVRAAAALHRQLLLAYRLAAPIVIRRSSPGHMQVHVAFDDQQRPQIRSGYLGANAELLAHGGFLLDPATGECHLPDALSPQEVRRHLITGLQRLRHHNFHITLHTNDGPRTHPPLPGAAAYKGKRR
ncbi:hypothetical protein AB0D59_32195 [Streptomyces sp. NPDC048417]|uniref:hypothetical protein n=1 Tax=Streptomyces sp. NPDC048417 TaxID=3155387 RepID=UPI00342EAF0C